MSHPPTLLHPYGTHCALPHYKVPNDWHPNNTGRAASCQVATHGRKGAWACCSPLAGPLSALFRISPRACAEKMSPTTTSRQQRADTRAWLWAQAIHASWSAASRRAQPERIATYAFWLRKAVGSPRAFATPALDVPAQPEARVLSAEAKRVVEGDVYPRLPGHIGHMVQVAPRARGPP